MTYITRIANKKILAKYFLHSLPINYLHWKHSASRSIFSLYATYGIGEEFTWVLCMNSLMSEVLVDITYGSSIEI